KAGKYELELTKGQEKVTLEGKEFTLKRGDTKVVTVRRNSSNPATKEDPDRRAAEHAFAVGGKIAIGGNRTINSLAELPKEHFIITHLFLGNTQVRDADLANFKVCNHLLQLGLENTRVSDVGLANFDDCTNLKLLNLCSTQASDKGLVYFKNCK